MQLAPLFQSKEGTMRKEDRVRREQGRPETQPEPARPEPERRPPAEEMTGHGEPERPPRKPGRMPLPD